jgi:hypothetical protein
MQSGGAAEASEVMDRIRGLINKTPSEKISVVVNNLICETLALIETELRARQMSSHCGEAHQTWHARPRIRGRACRSEAVKVMGNSHARSAAYGGAPLAGCPS